MIRKAEVKDREELLRIYAAARDFMRATGNPTQWGTDRPSVALIDEDLQKGRNYVIEEDGHIGGVFALLFGVEPTYLSIDGAWPDDDPYVTIHRIASDGSIHGVLGKCLDFTEDLVRKMRTAGSGPELPAKIPESIRIDTHEDNLVMRHLIEKYGFTYCGVIIVDDGTPRLAYERALRRKQMYRYKTRGTCSQAIFFDVEDNKVKNVKFISGCNGNTQGVAALVDGMDIDEAIRRIKGIDCNGRGTSCPDQLATALIQYKEGLLEEA